LSNDTRDDEASSIFTVRRIAPHVRAITELRCVHCYLLEGRDWALLIDSGLGHGDIRALVEQLTDRPVVVVNTHVHPDHVGGNHAFDAVSVHAAEADWLDRDAPVGEQAANRIEWVDGRLASGPMAARPWSVTHRLSHGDTLDLGGGIRLEAWHTPGHTPGSVCLLDESSRFLFTGDTVYAGPLALHFDESDLPAFAESIKGLESIGWDTNLVLPGHGETPLDGGILLEVGSGVRRLLDGEGRYQEIVWDGQPAYNIDLGRFSIRTRRSYRSGG
jgi:glyoxylase-like metal-dependent hydrolase (beta-lactamase superfamily II)